MSGNIMNQVNQDLNECISLINKGMHTFIVRPTFYPKEELLSLIINLMKLIFIMTENLMMSLLMATTLKLIY